MNTHTIDRQGAVARVMLTRPEQANTLDAATVRGLREAFVALRDDKSVRSVVLTGAGIAFSIGWDWESLKADSALATLDNFRVAGVLDDPFGCIADLPKPVVAAINGDAIGGGLALALAADIRIASESAHFALPEVESAMIPMAGATQRLVRLVGRGNALHMVLTGETIDAQEALRIGLVSEVVPHEAVMPRASAIAERIAERGPLAVQYAKEAISRGVDMPLEQALRYETDLTVILQTTEDREEGVQAFLEKIRAEFKGQ